jgi:hypothetical protein
VSDDNQDTSNSNRTSLAGFKRVATTDEPVVADPVDADQQSGFSLQKKLAEKARQDDEDSQNETGFFRDEGKDGESGFSVGGTDSDGAGFHLPAPAMMSAFGGKWLFVHPEAVLHDGRTMHAKWEKGLNRSFDKMIKHAIKHKWQGILLQQGIAGRVAAGGPLTRALNRRIQFLANPPPGQEKYARKIIAAMGYNPDNAEVKAQLQTLRTHAVSTDELLRLTTTPPTPPAQGASTTAPGTPGQQTGGPPPPNP